MAHRKAIYNILVYGVVALGGISAPRASHGQSSPVPMVPARAPAGPLGFEQFTPGACAHVPFALSHLLVWNTLDTAAYRPDQDTLAASIRDSLRVCARVYATRTVSPLERLNVARVQWLFGDDSAARATTARYLADLHADGPRAWAYYLMIRDLLSTQPARIAAARETLVLLDRLPQPVAAKAQFLAHSLMARAAQEHWEDTVAEAECNAAIAAFHHLPDSIYRGGYGMPLAVLYLQKAEHALRLRGGAAARAVLDTARQEPEIRRILIENYAQRIAIVDQPAAAIRAPFWFHVADGGRLARPRQGVVTIVQGGILQPGNRADVAFLPLRRYLARFSSQIEIVHVARTTGYFADTAPVSVSAEVRHDSLYFLETLRLPGALAIEETKYTWADTPDNRRRDEPTPQQNFYKDLTVIVDKRGIVRYVSNGILPIMEEPIARLIARLLAE